MNNNTFTKFKSLPYILTVASALIFGCSKKETAVSSNYEIQRQRSLELERPVERQDVPLAAEQTEATASADAAAPKVTESNTLNIAKSENAEKSVKNTATALTEKQLKKVEKLKKLIEKKSIKMAEKAEKKNGGINSNIKLGLILVIAGILIAVILGGLVHGYIFGTIGTIVAIIGLVFIILGLLEM